MPAASPRRLQRAAVVGEGDQAVPGEAGCSEMPSIVRNLIRLASGMRFDAVEQVLGEEGEQLDDRDARDLRR